MINQIIKALLLGLLFIFSNFSSSENLTMNNENALDVSYKAWDTAYTQKYTYTTVWAYIDFTQPASVKRFHVMDGKTELYTTYVAHGINSGDGLYADTFSNEPNSLETSLGVYRTGHYYVGKHGKSMRLEGLEWKINDNVYARNIVIHAANYVGPPKFGHSWGCFAIPDSEVDTDIKPIEKILELLKPGTIIVAYYPDGYWDHISKFLVGP